VARRRRGLRSGRVAPRHPGLVAASSAAAVAGLSVTQRLIKKSSAERALEAQRRYQIARKRGTGPELRRVAVGQLEIALEALQGQPPTSEEIHEARKALKRGRALLRVGRLRLGREVFRRENRSLRDAGRALSATRDAQVLGEMVQTLAAEADDRLPPGSLHRLQEAVKPQSRPESEPDLPAVRQAISEASSRVAHWPLPAGGKPSALAPGMKRIYRQGRQALRQIRKDRGDESWHELRKRSKDLWYSAELLKEAHPKRMQKLAKRAHRLSSFLGDDHDLAVLSQRIGEHPTQLSPDDLTLINVLIERRRRELQSQARRLAERIYRRKPAKAMSRLGL
jgi:CHAD domain-containing protein